MPTTEPAAPSHDFLPDPPASRGKTVLLSLAVLFGSMKLTGWIDDSGSQSYRGVLQAHSTTIVADREVRVIKLLVEEGASAGLDDPIVVVTDEELDSQIEAKKNETASLKLALSKAKAQTEMDLAWRTKQLDTEILETRLRSAEFLKHKFDQDVEKTAWNDVISESGLVLQSRGPESVFRPVDYQTVTPGRLQMEALLRQSAAVNASEVSKVQIQLCEDRLKELEQLKQELPEKIRLSAGVDAAESRYQQAVDELAELESRQPEITLTSTGYGTVGVFRKAIGKRVKSGEPIVEIFDNDRRFLVVHIPSEDLSAVTKGDELMLQFPGGELRRGVVISIPPQTGKTSSGGRDDFIAVRVEPFGKLWPEVPIGTSVEVTLEN